MDSIRAPQALAELKLGAYTNDWPSMYAPYIIASFTLKHHVLRNMETILSLISSMEFYSQQHNFVFQSFIGHKSGAVYSCATVRQEGHVDAQT